MSEEKIEITKPDFQYYPSDIVTDGTHIYEIIAPYYNITDEEWSYYVNVLTGDEITADLIWCFIIHDDFQKIDENWRSVREKVKMEEVEAGYLQEKISSVLDDIISIVTPKE